MSLQNFSIIHFSQFCAPRGFGSGVQRLSINISFVGWEIVGIVLPIRGNNGYLSGLGTGKRFQLHLNGRRKYYLVIGGIRAILNRLQIIFLIKQMFVIVRWSVDGLGSIIDDNIYSFV